jgi:DNA primase catalytic subunit
MRLSEIIRYYSNKDVCAELLRIAKDREIATQFGSAFGKRPDTLQFPADITKQVRSGATSFHCSEERWSNPLSLNPAMSKQDLDKLRIGFDLVLDIDCKILDWGRACAKLLLQALKWHGIDSYSIKFSGGSGWHIGVPFEAFPMDERIAFPDAPQAIAAYLKEFIRAQLSDDILEIENDLKKLAEKAGKPAKQLIKDGTFDPFAVLSIDTILISSRHLFRMPYSLNEKKWLVSLPIKEKDLDNFSVDWAKPANVVNVRARFLDTTAVKPGDASQLLTQAFDWQIRKKEKFEAPEKIIKVEYEDKVPEEAFPPCLKCVLKGLPDGRKRSLFALINFLKNAKWGWQEIEAFVYKWNNINQPPLKTGYIKSQQAWHMRSPQRIPPPNCREFYKDIGVCNPDRICDRIKNPLSYPKFLNKRVINLKPGKRSGA